MQQGEAWSPPVHAGEPVESIECSLATVPGGGATIRQGSRAVVLGIAAGTGSGTAVRRRAATVSAGPRALAGAGLPIGGRDVTVAFGALAAIPRVTAISQRGDPVCPRPTPVLLPLPSISRSEGAVIGGGGARQAGAEMAGTDRPMIIFPSSRSVVTQRGDTVARTGPLIATVSRSVAALAGLVTLAGALITVGAGVVPAIGPIVALAGGVVSPVRGVVSLGPRLISPRPGLVPTLARLIALRPSVIAPPTRGVAILRGL